MEGAHVAESVIERGRNVRGMNVRGSVRGSENESERGGRKEKTWEEKPAEEGKIQLL